jgi:hypothetical protein
MAELKNSTETKLQIRRVKLPATGTSVRVTVYDKTDKMEKVIPVSFRSVDESMKQDGLSFPLLRRATKRKHMDLIIPAGATLSAHKEGDAYGEEGKTYGSDGFHVDLPTYKDDDGNVKPSAFMEIDWNSTDAADDYADSLPTNRTFVPLIPIEADDEAANPF